MRVSALLSGFILVALGSYGNSKSSAVLEFLNETPTVRWAVTSLLGASVTPIILLVQLVSLAALLAGFLGIIYGTAVPTKNKLEDRAG